VSLGRTGKSTLGTLTCGTKTTKGTLVLTHVLLGTTLKVLKEIVNHAVIEILSSQVGVSSGGLDLKDSLLNGQKTDIEGSSSKIEDEHILLLSLLVKTVGDSSGGRLIDDTKDVQSRNGSGILGGLTLRVVEVGGDGDDGVLDLLSEVSLGNLLHFGENHGRDFLSLELLGLSLVFHLDDGGSSGSGDDLERPVVWLEEAVVSN
jgi:hypothetical protein